jgi:hypothetical protein
MIEQFTPKMFRQFGGTKRSVAEGGGVGGYWNDDDQCSEDR